MARRLVAAWMIVAAALLAPPRSALAYTDSELERAFLATVFGAEYAGWGWQAHRVKRFHEPVRFHIDDRSGLGRGAEAARFVASLPESIANFEAHLVAEPRQANFRIFIVGRADYARVVREEVYQRPTAAHVPGRCLVRVVSSWSGIRRSDAVIVADEGDFLFRRCLIEEVLQGLGPVNDNDWLIDSVFNDRSRHATFTRHDRFIMNILYHPAIRAGMTEGEVRRLLPRVIAETRQRLR